MTQTTLSREEILARWLKSIITKFKTQQSSTQHYNQIAKKAGILKRNQAQKQRLRRPIHL